MPPLLSLGAGLSELGKNVAQTAQAYTLEAQKAEEQRRGLELADRLAGARESAGRAETHNYGMIQQAARIEAEAPERAARVKQLNTSSDLALSKDARDQATGKAVSEELGRPGGADYQRKFIESVKDYADEASKKTGVDPRLIIAQAALESDWGRKAPGNNYFGVKGTAGSPDSQMLATKEAGPGGELYDTQAAFRKYASPGESFAHYAETINKNPAYAAVRGAKDLDAQIAAIGKSGYATDPAYGQKVGSIAKSLDTLSQSPEDRATIKLAQGGASEAKDALTLRERRRESEATIAQNEKAASKLQIGADGVGYYVNPQTGKNEPALIDGKPIKFADPEKAKQETELIRSLTSRLSDTQRSYMPEILAAEATVRKLQSNTMISSDKDMQRELTEAKDKARVMRDLMERERAPVLSQLNQLGLQLSDQIANKTGAKPRTGGAPDPSQFDPNVTRPLMNQGNPGQFGGPH